MVALRDVGFLLCDAMQRGICCRRVPVRPCPPDCPSQAVGTVPKRLNLGSRKQRRTIAQALWYSKEKNVCEIPTASPPKGRQIEVGYVMIGDFRPISRYISKMVQDRDILLL